MTIPNQFADVLGEFVRRSGYSAGQLQQLSGVPRRTIANWLEGRVKRPRRQTGLLKLAAALHLNASEVNQLLYLAGHPAIETLLTQATDQETKALLAPWTEAINSRSEYSPFQVIPDLPYFVGRTAVVQMIQEMILGNRSPKIYCLHGMAGAGKTALAVRVAYQLRPYFPDGVLWARLDTSDIPSTLNSFAQAYGRTMDNYTDMDSRSRILRELLASKRALILLDNVEHSEQVTPFLPPSTSDCVVIITTRRGDLDITLGASRFLIGPFSQEESLQLFSEILTESVVREHAADFIELADLLGHLPLAIAIVAGRLAHEPRQEVTEFLKKLQSNRLSLDELASESQSVSLSFSLSYTDLTPLQQYFFTSLGVFEGEDFSVDASAHVSDLSPRQTRNLLRELFTLSLLQVRESGRYALHPLLRLFAFQKLDDEAVFSRFIEYFAHFVEAHQANTNALAPECCNIAAAIRLAFARGMLADGVRTTIAFVPYLANIGAYEKAIQHLEQARTVIEDKNGEIDKSCLSTIWRLIGKIAGKQGQYEQAQSYIEKSLNLAQQNQDEQSTYSSLCALGNLLVHRGNYEKAQAYLQESLLMAEAREDWPVACDALTTLGILYGRLGNPAEAEAAFQRGLKVARQLGNKVQACRLLNNLGTVNRRRGDYAQAETYFQESFLLSQQINHGENSTICLNNLALVAQKQGNYESAETLIEEALTIARRIGFRLGLSQSLVNMGMLESALGKYEQARQNLFDGLQMARELNHPWTIALTLNELGALFIANSDPDAASKLFGEARSIGQQIGAKEILAEALFGLAQVAWLRGAPVEARDLAQDSMAAYKAASLEEAAEQIRIWLQEHG